MASFPSSGFSFSGTAAAPSTGFGGFGTMASTTAPSFSFGGFGNTPATTTGFSFGNFGSTTTAANPGYGLGGGFSGGSSIMAPSTVSAPSGFGTFGSMPPATTSSTGFSFGSGLTSGFGGSSFATGNGLQSGGLFGRQQQSSFGAAPSVQPSVDQMITALASALFCPVLYGDERDNIIAKWNRLQAFWGTGKGYYSVSLAPVDFTQENPFCKFKAVGYSCLPSSKNEDGLLSLVFGQRNVDVRSQQPQVIDGLHRLLGSKPNLVVCVEGIKPYPDNKSEVTIYVIDRPATGISHRIPSSELFAYLNQPTLKPQLNALGVEAVIPKAFPSSEHIKYYLQHPPAGIDALVWQQGVLDNPQSKRLIPVPIIGFGELNRRLKFQEEETTKVHQGRLLMIGNELKNLENNRRKMEAVICDIKRKHFELSHRVLKVMVRQEANRKLGLAVQADEEQLRLQFEVIQTELSAPNQAKGRLNELMAQIRLQKEHLLVRANDRYTLDPALQDEIKQHMLLLQEGLSHLIDVVKEVTENLKTMDDGLKHKTYQRK